MLGFLKGVFRRNTTPPPKYIIIPYYCGRWAIKERHSFRLLLGSTNAMYIATPYIYNTKEEAEADLRHLEGRA